MQVKEASLKQIPKKLEELPPFVTDFYNYHKVNTQPTTNLAYLREIERFCTWLRTHTGTDYAQPISSAADNRHITMRGSINQTISALKSFFKYMSVDSEVGTSNKPFLSYNPMLKVKVEKDSETLNYRTQKISDQLFVDEEQALVDFIDNDYEDMLKSKQARYAFNRNKSRDLAMIATMLGSGVRISELAGLDMNDVHIKKEKNTGKIEYSAELEVIRKGNYKDRVFVVPWTVKYLVAYLEERKEKYHADDSQPAVFLTLFKGQSQRITTRSIEKLTSKYTKAYGRPSTPHKLRHTLGTELYRRNRNIVAVAQQLGQTSTSATDRYTHVGDGDLYVDLLHIGENTDKPIKDNNKELRQA